MMFLRFLFLLPLIFYTTSYSALNFKSGTSSLKINSGSNLVTENSFDAGQGKIVKNLGATISGSDISFTQGTLEDSGTAAKVTGVYSSGDVNRITLNGNKSFVGRLGQILQSIQVSGQNNSLKGEFLLSEDIVLQDVNTTISCEIFSKLGNNIQLNNGTILLNDDLRFADDKRVLGPGRMVFNGYRLSLGAKNLTWSEAMYFDNASDIELNANLDLEESWTFSGVNILNGNYNILYLQDKGKIVVDRGSSLLVKNITLRNVKNNNFFCMDNATTITFQDVSFVQDSDFTFSNGIFYVVSRLSIKGGYKFVYQSPKSSRIESNATMFLDKNVTLSLDLFTPLKNPIIMQDSTSILYLNGATLHATSTGLQLTKGTLEVNGKCYLSSDATCQNEGLMLGDGVSADNNLSIEVLPDSNLKLLSGYLAYSNV
jgi:hypothetical protein